MILEVCDREWNTIGYTHNIIGEPSINEALGSTDGDGSVSIPLDDDVVALLPNPDANEVEDYRFKLWEDNPADISPNLVTNSSFEMGQPGNVTGWIAPAGWIVPFAPTETQARHGAFTAHLSLSNTFASALRVTNSTFYTAVDRTKPYTVSFKSRVTDWSGGAASLKVEVKERNAAGTLLTSTYLDLFYNHDWTSFAMFFGPVTSGSIVGFQATTATIDVEFWVTGGTHTVEWDVDALQIEQNHVATNYRPKQGEGSDVELIFAGLIDVVRKSGNEVTIGGKQRGVELAGKLVGRRDFLAWSLPEAFREFTRDNIGRAPFATVSTSDEKTATPALAAITGEVQKGQYWAPAYTGARPTVFTNPEWITIDLGSTKHIDMVRVVPEWWSGKYYKYKVYVSGNKFDWTEIGEQPNPTSSTPSGVVLDTNIDGRYVKVEVFESSDGYPRIAGVFVMQNVAQIGLNTDYTVPWIENNNSGNITYSASTRVSQNGAWLGDDFLSQSSVNRLGTGGWAQHKFRGTADAVYFSGEAPSTIDVAVDGITVANDLIVPAGYQVKAYEVTGLPNADHTLRVTQVTGAPQIDYFTGLFQSSYRRAEEDHTNFAFNGNWTTNYDSQLSGGSLKWAPVTTTAGWYTFDFFGDSIKIFCKKNVSRGRFNWYIDGFLQGNVDLYSASPVEQAQVASWTGTYGKHQLFVSSTPVKNPAATGFGIDVDRVEGNWAHQIYLRSDQATNLQMLQNLAESTNSFLRLNYDGTVDLLSAVGTDTGEIIRDGENEGGNIISADISGDWTNAVSAVLALGQGSDNYALRVLVKDQNSVNRIGIKIAKIELREIPDAYMLVRMAWQALQDAKIPKRSYDFEYDPRSTGRIRVGDTVRVWSPKYNLNGDTYRVFEKQSGGTNSPVTVKLANKRDRLSELITRTARNLSVQSNTPQGYLSTSQYGGAPLNLTGTVPNSTDFYIDDSASVISAKIRISIVQFEAYVDSTQGAAAVAGHTHAMNYTIIKQAAPTAVTVVLDGVNINNILDGPLGSGQHDGDLTNVLQIPGWHTLSFTTSPGTHARVIPYVLVKTLHYE